MKKAFSNRQILKNLRDGNFFILEKLDKYELKDFQICLKNEFIPKGVIDEDNTEKRYRPAYTEKELEISNKRETIEREKRRQEFEPIIDMIQKILDKPTEQENNVTDLLDIDFEKGLQKIIFLNELGVIDFLRREYNNPANTKLGEILKLVTNLKPDTIRKYLDKITNEEISDSQKSTVLNIINKLKLNRKSQ